MDNSRRPKTEPSESNPPKAVKVESAQVGVGVVSDVGAPSTSTKEKDVTHGGVRKVKFQPKIPAMRRKKVEAAEAETADSSGAVDKALHRSILQQSRDEAGRVGRTVQQLPNFADKKGPRLARGNTYGQSVQMGGGGLGAGSFPQDKQRSKEEDFRFALDPKARVKLSVEELIEDPAAYHPILVREPEVPVGEPPTAAASLHLDSDQPEERISLFQLPTLLPWGAKDTQGMTQLEQEIANAAPSTLPGGGWLNGLDGGPGGATAGSMGKVRVYASGAVKLVLGNVQFDMAPGNPIACAQQLAAIDPAAGKAVFLGNVQQRVVVTPDIAHLLSTTSISDLDDAQPNGTPGS